MFCLINTVTSIASRAVNRCQLNADLGDPVDSDVLHIVYVDVTLLFEVSNKLAKDLGHVSQKLVDNVIRKLLELLKCTSLNQSLFLKMNFAATSTTNRS